MGDIRGEFFREKGHFPNLSESSWEVLKYLRGVTRYAQPRPLSSQLNIRLSAGGGNRQPAFRHRGGRKAEGSRLTGQPGGHRIDREDFCTGLPSRGIRGKGSRVQSGEHTQFRPRPGISLFPCRGFGFNPCPQHGLVRPGFLEIEGLGALEAPDKLAFTEIRKVPLVGFVHR